MQGNVIYIDILLAVNLFVNYFLLLATGKFVTRPPKRWRMVVGAATGSLFSLLILFDSVGFILVLFFKLILAASLVLIAFGFISWPVYLKTTAIFFGINFLFAGVMLALWLVVTPAGMYYRNGTVYFNISALTLVISTIVAYLVVKLICFVRDRHIRREETCDVLIECDGKQALLTGFADTGNKLCDVFTNKPIVVCEFDQIRDLIPKNLHKMFASGISIDESVSDACGWTSRIRVVPCHTVSGEGLLPAFLPDAFYLLTGRGRRERREVLVAVTSTRLSQGEFHAILNPELLTTAK